MGGAAEIDPATDPAIDSEIDPAIDPEIDSETDAGYDAEIDRFVRLDLAGAFLGLLVVLVANGLVVKNTAIWLVVPGLLFLIGALSLARFRLKAGRVIPALFWITVGNWVLALLVAVLLPFLWPVMALTVLMPLVLASTRLGRSQILPAIIATAVAAALVAAIGLLNDDGGAIEDIEDSAEVVLVAGALVAQILPIGLIVWQHNNVQRLNVQRLEALNRELQRSEAELEASRDRVVQAGDTERRRIERDLHDGAQQRLVSLGVRLRLLQSVDHQDPMVQESVDLLVDELDGTVAEVRELAHGIYPPLLQTRGLPDALMAIVRRSPTAVDVDISAVGRLDQHTESAFYFITREALANAAKHAPEARVSLSLAHRDDELVLQISDNGRGFDPASTQHSHGFLNMRDRLAAVGGSLRIRTEPGQGTSLTAIAPRRPAGANAS